MPGTAASYALIQWQAQADPDKLALQGGQEGGSAERVSRACLQGGSLGEASKYRKEGHLTQKSFSVVAVPTPRLVLLLSNKLPTEAELLG